MLSQNGSIFLQDFYQLGVQLCVSPACPYTARKVDEHIRTPWLVSIPITTIETITFDCGCRYFVMAEKSTGTLISNLIVEDLNLKETQFEIIKESSSLDGSVVCTVRYMEVADRNTT